MNRNRILVCVVIILVMCSACQGIPFPENPEMTTQDTKQEPSPNQLGAEPRSVSLKSPLPVALRAASGKTIRFEADGRSPAELPHLVLTRNGKLTAPAERSLEIQVSGIEIPVTGATVTISLETQHTDPDRNEPGERIHAWSESIPITNTSGAPQAGVTVTFQHEFSLNILSESGPVLTPTDYYRLGIDLSYADQGKAEPIHWIDLEYAFLLESQWVVPLPEVLESSPGAAPDELVVYACDMFMPAGDSTTEEPGISRQNLSKVIQKKIIPQMVAAFQTQTDAWQFPWYAEWTSFRDETKVLSVALSDGETWYHGPAPSLGNAEISIKLERQDFRGGNADPKRLLSVFHHELFHNLQRNIQQHYGGNGDVDGQADAWAFVTEGMAIFAASAGQPGFEFGAEAGEDSYLAKANQFIMRDLNSRYQETNPYRSAIYWRFLYEQCDGLKPGTEAADPATGMRLIRQVLETLYSGDVVDIASTQDLVKYLPGVMDGVLADSACPFHSYEDSLVAFARAIYALRREDGRCTQPGQPEGCGLVDPDQLYAIPQAAIFDYPGQVSNKSYMIQPPTPGPELAPTVDLNNYLGPTDPRLVDPEIQPGAPGIPNSFGMIFIEIRLDPALNGKSLSLKFAGIPGSPTRFNVQILELGHAGENTGAQIIAGRVVSQEQYPTVTPGGSLEVTLPSIDTTAVDTLALIITRLDSQENEDPLGMYTLTLMHE